MSQGTGMDQSLLEAQICLFRAQLKASQGTAKYIAIERMVGEVGALATASNGREDGDSSANGLDHHSGAHQGEDGSLDVKLLEMTEKLMEYKGAEEALKVAQTQSEHANFVLSAAQAKMDELQDALANLADCCMDEMSKKLPFPPSIQQHAKIAMTKFISDLDLRYYLDFFVDRGRGFQRFLAWLQTDPSQTALLHAIMNGNGSNSNSSGSISSSSSSTDIITAQAQHSNPCSELIPRQLKQGVAGVFDSSLSNDTNGYGVLPVNGNGHAYGGASTDEEDKSDGAHSDDWHHRDGSRQAGSGSEAATDNGRSQEQTVMMSPLPHAMVEQHAADASTKKSGSGNTSAECAVNKQLLPSPYNIYAPLDVRVKQQQQQQEAAAGKLPSSGSPETPQHVTEPKHSPRKMNGHTSPNGEGESLSDSWKVVSPQEGLNHSGDQASSADSCRFAMSVEQPIRKAAHVLDSVPRAMIVSETASPETGSEAEDVAAEDFEDATHWDSNEEQPPAQDNKAGTDTRLEPEPWGDESESVHTVADDFTKQRSEASLESSTGGDNDPGFPYSDRDFQGQSPKKPKPYMLSEAMQPVLDEAAKKVQRDNWAQMKEDWGECDSLFIGNLSNYATEEMVWHGFEGYSLNNVKIIRERLEGEDFVDRPYFALRFAGRVKGFGFLKFTTPEDALIALLDKDRTTCVERHRPIRLERNNDYQRMPTSSGRVSSIAARQQPLPPPGRGNGSPRAAERGAATAATGGAREQQPTPRPRWPQAPVNFHNHNQIDPDEILRLNCKKLYVGNLPYWATESHVAQAFAECQPEHVKICRDGRSSSKGFGFLTFRSAAQAHETYITMNQRTLATLGRTLVLGLDQDVYHTAPAEPRRPPGLDSRGQSSSEIPKSRAQEKLEAYNAQKAKQPPPPPPAPRARTVRVPTSNVMVKVTMDAPEAGTDRGSGKARSASSDSTEGKKPEESQPAKAGAKKSEKKKKVQPKKKAASVANIEGNATAADGNPFAALAADSA